MPHQGLPPGPYARLADRAMSSIAGTQDAQRVMYQLREIAPADLLLLAFQQVQATGDAERMRAFARTIQKRIEGTA
jgi:hypothetical protein